MSRAAILLKSPPHDFTHDPYVERFETAGYTPHFVEILQTVFTNEQRLEDVVRTGPSHGSGFLGVVITSSRAAEAWVKASGKVEPGIWSETPFYVVGETTSRALKQITVSHPTKFSESLILGAAQSGKSESLAQFVVSDLPNRRPGGKLLYLTGDKNRDTFHKVMSENNVDVESLMVYETKATNDLEEQIQHVVQKLTEGTIHPGGSANLTPVEGRHDWTWVISFAPSSSDFALPYLRKYFRLQVSQVAISPDSIQDTQPELRAKFGAIGPTTAAFLHSERHLHIDAVAAKPTAEALIASIRESDAKEE